MWAGHVGPVGVDERGLKAVLFMRIIFFSMLISALSLVAGV